MSVHRAAPLPSNHAEWQWRQRGDPRLDVREAWMAADAIPAVADSLGNDAARYHERTDTLLVADSQIITVYERDDDRWEHIWRIVDEHLGGQP